MCFRLAQGCVFFVDDIDASTVKLLVSQRRNAQLSTTPSLGTGVSIIASAANSPPEDCTALHLSSLFDELTPKVLIPRLLDTADQSATECASAIFLYPQLFAERTKDRPALCV